ncbi:MAG: hypothetical protein JXA03_11100 [Bacteroidales bacterium]|nr:hypothetical protein [Bacteroidales bacterium]
MKKFSIFTMALSLITLFTMAQTPVLHWRFANPVVFDNAGVCTLEFDVELSCDMADTYHSDLQVYFDYNTLAFGENVVTNGVLTYTRLPLLQGDLAGTPLYAIFGNVDNKPYRYAILSEATFTVANPMFMNAVPMLPTYGGYIKVQMIIADQNQLAGIEYVPEDGGVGLMNGGQYYLDATHPTATKYGVPPDYAGVYENDLLTQALMCVTGDNNWTGAVDNDWFNPGNWSLNVVPTNEDVVIPDVGTKAPFPVIFTGSATTGAITISPMASLEIAPTGDLTANGLVTNDGDLLITSDGAGFSGSFIDNAGVAGAGMFYFIRNITNSSAQGNPTGWHYLSSPVNGFTSHDLFDYWVNRWDEATDKWVQDTIDPAIPCVPAPLWNMGDLDAWSVKFDMNYSCAAINPAQGMDIDFMGTMADYRNGTYSAPVTYTGGNVYAGYNLVGNPYSSSVDPATFTWGPNMNQSTYYWDGWANTYFSWAGGIGSMVPPTQGFFVSAFGGDNFGLAPANRAHETTQYFYKNEISNLLKLKAEGNNYSDVTYVRFHNEATAGFDKVWDAYKLISNVPEVPQIYTTLGGTNYSINAVESTDAMPMAFSAGVSGNYSISIEENNDFDVVYLEDLKTGKMHDLSTAYEFSYNAGDDANRFVIHFGQISLDNAQNGIVVYSYNNHVYVYNANNLQGDIMIYGVMGQVVTSAQLEGGLNMITLNDVNNYYVVKVLTESIVVSEKVYIK